MPQDPHQGKPAFRPPLRRDAPRPRKYSLSRHGTVAGNSSTLFFKPGTPLEVTSPAFDGGHTIYRPLPMMDYDNPSQFTRSMVRGLDGNWEPSDFMRPLPAVRYLGIDRQVSFLLYDPTDEGAANVHWTNPAIVFIDTIRQAVDPPSWRRPRAGDFEAPRSWDPLVKGQKAPIPRWGHYLFMQVLTYVRDREQYFRETVRGLGPEDRIPCLVVPATKNGVGTRIMASICEEDLDGADPDYPFKLGDVCGFENGKFLYIWNKQKEVAPTANPQSRKDKVDSFGYDFAWDSRLIVSRTLIRGVTPQLSEKQIAIVAPKIQWWDDVLYYPSQEAIAELVAQAFASRPDLIKFAWQRHPEFFTPAVKKILAHARSVVVEGIPGAEDVGEDETPPVRQSQLLRPASSRRTEAVFEEVPLEEESEAALEEEMDPAASAFAQGVDSEEEGLFDEEAVEEDEIPLDEDDVPAAPPRSVKGSNAAAPQDELDELLDDVVDIDEDTPAIPPAPLPPRRRKATPPVASEEDDEMIEDEQALLDALQQKPKKGKK